MAGSRETQEEREGRLYRDRLSADRARRRCERRAQEEREAQERRRRNQEQQMANANVPPTMPPPNMPPRTMLSEEEARLYIRNNTPLEPGVTLPEGWVTNIVNVPVAPRLSGQARVDYINLCRTAMSWEERRDPKYAVSAPYWDRTVEAEYEARRGSFFLPAGMREPPPEWVDSDDDDDAPLPPAPAIAGESSTTTAASRSPKTFIVIGRTLRRGGRHG
jgi:hypothetical protein